MKRTLLALLIAALTVGNTYAGTHLETGYLINSHHQKVIVLYDFDRSVVAMILPSGRVIEIAFNPQIDVAVLDAALVKLEEKETADK